MTTTRLARLAGVLAVAVVVVAGFVGGETPDGDDSLREITQFYRDNDAEQVWAGVMLAWSAGFFLVFLSAFWKALREAEGVRRGASTLALAGGIVFAVGLTIFASTSFLLGEFGDDLTPVALQALNAMSSGNFFTAIVGLFGFLLGSGAAVVRTGVLPKWLGWVAIVMAPIAVTPIGFFVVLASGIWILVVSVLLALRPEAAPAGRI
jgi:hypothetical protein